jgi:hypothetical protein
VERSTLFISQICIRKKWTDEILQGDLANLHGPLDLAEGARRLQCSVEEVRSSGR